MLRNSNGVTLVELLAAITLLSLILILANSFHLFGQKQMIRQSSEIQEQANVRLALNVLSNEVRTGEVEIPIKENRLVVKTGNTTNIYVLEGQQLTKNGTPFIQDIGKFSVENSAIQNSNHTSQKILIEITSIPDKNGHAESVSTTIFNRVNSEVANGEK